MEKLLPLLGVAVDDVAAMITIMEVTRAGPKPCLLIMAKT